MTPPLTTPAVARTVDAWGRTIFQAEDAAEIMLSGHPQLEHLLFAPSPALRDFNAQCDAFDAPEWKLHVAPPPTDTADAHHAARRAAWWVPAEFAEVAVRPLLLARCPDAAARDRVNHEMDLFEQRGLVPLLRMMLALVAHLRARGVVWGVGRGSSVASYCLYLTGIHKIDSLRYGLAIEEFLR